MKRVVILGAPGSGKSTLAKKLAAALDIPAFHLEALFWHPGWTPTPAAEWTALVRKLIEAESWIIEGNNLKTLDIRLPAGDTIVFLDFGRLVCLYRIFKRRLLLAVKPHPGLAPGCKPQFDLQLLKWVWAFRTADRLRIHEALGRAADNQTVVVLRTPKEVRRFLSVRASRICVG